MLSQNKAIKDTESLISAQKKVNKGIEDMRGAIVEVSEEETMVEFEEEIILDKVDMPSIASQIRQAIIPQAPFVNFGRLASDINVDDIKDAFDIRLSEIVREKHNNKADSDKKVLGMNIITQLQQKLQSEEDIRSFAYKIVQQSGVYLRLNNDQIQLHVRNNEADRSPSNPNSINMRAILVSIPKPTTDSQKAFAAKLEESFKSSFAQGNAITTLAFDTDSPRENELSIVTISYCYPMRCAEWLLPYRDKYNQSLNTGNKITDRNNRILLHTEGDGTQLPSLFVVDKVDKVLKGKTGPNPQTPPSIPTGMPDLPLTEPEIQLYIAAGGQKYGPYDFATCKKLKTSGQLTERSLIWHEGLTSWIPAGQAPALKQLFAPELPPIPDGMPDLPPMI